ncbi:LysR family transcriptional regulator [Dictyobacter aurantiacus]|uniref:LysR family transcriptional regulator n=1 Tax=Dictyobacter aurantiacus TaxID=1936993 RepID=A0A401ZSI1_9CHLR|nr:LysR family transcriptional regulator [Dictyobacter aurantiacus]GCE09740.1 LysR family transcriptional regulator [Dictyobacter aurantiacus]
MHNDQLELRHVRAFMAVSQELHFRRAAEKLYIAQPALSQQILQLERILGVRLFERNHHGVRLTSAGELFVQDAARILEQVDLSLMHMQQAQSGQWGRLEIGFVNAEVATMNIIPEVLTSYRRHFPEVTVQLKEMYLQEQLQSLKEQRIQAGFAATFEDLPAEFDAEVLQHVPFVAVCSERHHFAHRSAVALADVIEEPFFFCPRDSDSGVLYERIERICGRSPRVQQEVSEIHILLGLVAADLGVSLVASSAMGLSVPGVVYLPLSDLDHNLAFRTVLLWRRDARSPLLQGFLAVAREVFAQRKKELLTCKTA